MSGICGWFPAVPSADADATLNTMASLLGPQADRDSGRALGARFGFAAAGLSAGVWSDERIVVALHGVAVWSSGAPAEIRDAEDPCRACALAYARFGAAFLEHMDGQFALALFDRARGQGLLAVDRTGVETLLYAPVAGGIVFATTSDAVRAHPAVDARLDSQALYDYVHFHMVPGPETVFAGVRRMLPGHVLEADAGHQRERAYWAPDYRHITRMGFGRRKARLLQLLQASVEKSLGAGPVGAFLSGGMDSSTVAGLLGRVTGAPARTYSIGFDADGYDETEYARTVARHFGTDHREYYVTPADVVKAVPLIARAYDYPFGNASAIPAYYCARLAAEDGVRTLLAGDGGDELFGGNARYGKQWLFSVYDRLPAALRRGAIEPALRVLPGAGPVGKLRSYVRQANLGMPDRMESYNLLSRLGPERVFTGDFLASVDRGRPLALVREIYHRAQASDMLNRMLALDMRITLADNDLRKVTRACDAAGVTATFPFLQRDLVEFAQTIPPGLKVRRTRLRYFYRKAMADFLPTEVLQKSKHGFGLPFGVWLQTDQALHELAGDSLTQLGGRGIVRREFIDELTSARVREHAAYYGTMVWVLMMLEQWLQHHDTTRVASETGARVRSADA